jgi:hypothetical protein
MDRMEGNKKNNEIYWGGGGKAKEWNMKEVQYIQNHEALLWNRLPASGTVWYLFLTNNTLYIVTCEWL